MFPYNTTSFPLSANIEPRTEPHEPLPKTAIFAIFLLKLSIKNYFFQSLLYGYFKPLPAKYHFGFITLRR